MFFFVFFEQNCYKTSFKVESYIQKNLILNARMKSFLSITFVLISVGTTTTVSDSVKEWKQGDSGRSRWAANCVFRIVQMDPIIGPALVFLVTPVEKCGEACLANPECHHFTYTSQKGLCTLLKKTRYDLKAVAFPQLSGSLCGYIPSRTRQPLQ